MRKNAENLKPLYAAFGLEGEKKVLLTDLFKQPGFKVCQTN